MEWTAFILQKDNGAGVGFRIYRNFDIPAILLLTFITYPKKKIYCLHSSLFEIVLSYEFQYILFWQSLFSLNEFLQ